MSTAVVSYVLNDGPRPVSSNARDRVLAAIEELGYRRDAVARSLRLGRSHSLGLVVPDIALPYFGQMTQEVSAQVTARNLQLLVAHSNYSVELERSQLATLADRRVDGLMLMSVDPSQDFGWLRRLGIPAVVVDRPQFAIQSSGLATEHLLGHGHRRINLITGEAQMVASSRRRQGWTDALQRAGVIADDSDAVATRPSPQEGARAIDELLDRGSLHPAIVIDSDVLAMGALRRLHELGRRVPEDVAVVSLDATPLAPLLVPSLTSVKQPNVDIARAAVDVVLQEGDEVVRWVDVADFELVLRESCGCGTGTVTSGDALGR